MVDVTREVDPDVVRRNLDEVRAGLPDPDRTQVLCAVKYVHVDALGALAEGGVTVVGENRAQDLAEKHARWGDAFTWDFIGQLQSRKVKDVLPLTRWVHSVGSQSAIDQLGKRGTPQTQVLLEVNVAGEADKAGFAPAELPELLAALPVTCVGLMTMPPFAADPEDSRRHFAALAQLAADHGLRELSMGTTQDWRVAAQEGATVIRLGQGLLR